MTVNVEKTSYYCYLLIQLIILITCFIMIAVIHSQNLIFLFIRAPLRKKSFLAQYEYIYTTFCSQEYVQWALGKYDMRCNYDVDARFLLWSTIFVISSGEKQMKVAWIQFSFQVIRISRHLVVSCWLLT